MAAQFEQVAAVSVWDRDFRQSEVGEHLGFCKTEPLAVRMMISKMTMQTLLVGLGTIEDADQRQRHRTTGLKATQTTTRGKRKANLRKPERLDKIHRHHAALLRLA